MIESWRRHYNAVRPHASLGQPIGVCARSSETEAEHSLLHESADQIPAGELAEELFKALKPAGEHDIPHEKMRGNQFWVSGSERLQTRHYEKLMELFREPVLFSGGSIKLIDTGKKTKGKYKFLIDLEG